jgi:MFS family permease
MRLSRALALIYCAGFLRSLGVGLLGVILAVYLSRTGVGTTSIGVVIGVGLLGACAATAWVAWAGVRIGCRRTLVTLSVLATAGGVALAILPSYPILLILVFVGMVNGMGTDRSAPFALEQAIIPGLIPDRSRTWGLSWYNVLLDGGGAIGALGAVLPSAVSAWAHIDLLGSYRYVFLGYASVHAMTALLYLMLPADRQLVNSPEPAMRVSAASRQSRRTVHGIAKLFAIDAFGGGLLSDALVSYWFFHRFGRFAIAVKNANNKRFRLASTVGLQSLCVTISRLRTGLTTDEMNGVPKVSGKNVRSATQNRNCILCGLQFVTDKGFNDANLRIERSW